MSDAPKDANTPAVVNPLSVPLSHTYSVLNLLHDVAALPSRQIPPKKTRGKPARAVRDFNERFPDWSDGRIANSNSKAFRESEAMWRQRAKITLQFFRDAFPNELMDKVREFDGVTKTAGLAAWSIQTLAVMYQICAQPFAIKMDHDLTLIVLAGWSRIPHRLSHWESLVRELAARMVELHVVLQGKGFQILDALDTNPKNSRVWSIPMQRKMIADKLGISVKKLKKLVDKGDFVIDTLSQQTHQLDITEMPPEQRQKFFSLS